MRLWQKALLAFVFGFFLWLFDTYREWFFFSINCLGKNEFWQNFMLALTQLADGNWILIIGFLFYPKRQGLILGFFLSFLISGAIVQIIKEAFPLPRPTVLFESIDYLCIPGIKHVNSTFPSGHATSTFVLVRLLIERASLRLKIFYFVVGALMALSRVYVGVHFLADVWAGSWLGYFVGNAILANYQHHMPKTNYYLRGLVSSLMGFFATSYFLLWHREKIESLKDYFSIVAIILLFLFAIRMLYYFFEWRLDRKLFKNLS